MRNFSQDFEPIARRPLADPSSCEKLKSLSHPRNLAIAALRAGGPRGLT